MQYAAIGPIAIYLPEAVEDNDLLKAQNPRWDMDLIYAKTGIRAGTSPLPANVPPTWAWRRPSDCSPSTRSIAAPSISSFSARKRPTIRCPPRPA